MQKEKIKKNIKLVFVLFLIILFLLISFLTKSKSNDETNTLQFSKSDLSSIILDYTQNGKYDVELLKKAQRNVLYGTIIDTGENGNLFLTKGLFTFNIVNNDFKYYENENNERIIDFLIVDDLIYKVILQNSENCYKWKLVIYNKDTKQNLELISGLINDIFNYPLLFFEGKDIYLIALNNFSEFTMEKCTFYKVTDKNIEELFSFSGSLIDNTGTQLYNKSNIKLFENSLYYTIVDENNIQYLKKYNLAQNKESTIIENKPNDYILYSYIPSKTGIYIQYANKNNQSANIKYKTMNIIKELKTELNFFENLINDNNILIHNVGNEWKIYNIEKNKIIELEANININMYPKYLYLENNKIITQDFEDNFYIGIIK